MSTYVPGLTPYRVSGPEIPTSSRFLFRREWAGADHRERFLDLVEADEHLYAALLWLHVGATRELISTANRMQLRALIEGLGLEVAREAALGVVLFRAFRMGRGEAFDYDEFWTRALARGLAARQLASVLGAEDPVRCFLSGLFSEFGKILLAESDPSRYDELFYDRDGSLTASLDQRERETFGIDRDTVSWVTLRDAGFPRAVFAPMLARSRKVRSGSQHELDDNGADEVVYRIACLIGDVIVADGSKRAELWRRFVALRAELDLSRDVLNSLGDLVVNDWWDWGDLLTVPTRTLPGFAELCDWNERGLQPIRFNPIGGVSLVPKSAGGGLHVLLVEDNPVVREGTRRRLERAGHQVQTARDGREALAILRQDPPQVVLSDWHMPEMDGLELCAHLRRSDLGRRTFFILFTGEEEEERIVRAYKVGINDFIAKNSPAAILLARVSAARTFLSQWEQVDEDRRIIRAHCEHSRRQAAAMKLDSMTDALTGLPNRRYAMERLREEWSRAERADEDLSVVVMDIDFFKKVNDEHGHDVGDLVLQETATVLKEVTRRNEAACRIGGEEFLIVCSDSDLEQAACCAERVRAAIEAHLVHVGAFDGNVTVSLGVAQRTEETANVSELFKAADEAIYAAKNAGRNRVVLWPSIAEAHFDDDQRLRRAI